MERVEWFIAGSGWQESVCRDMHQKRKTRFGAAVAGFGGD